MWNYTKKLKPTRPSLSSNLKRKIKGKYSNRCLCCGKKETIFYSDSLYIHHIYPYKGNEDFNIMPLCFNCHIEIHDYIRKNTRRIEQDWVDLTFKFFQKKDLQLNKKDEYFIRIVKKIRERHPLWAEKQKN